MENFSDLLLAGIPCCLFYVLIVIARFSLVIGFIERPLALALGAGLLTGSWDVAVPLGITLELLWLDNVGMGNIIPPLSGLSFLLLFPICNTFDWASPSTQILPLAAGVLAASLGSWLEQQFRQHENKSLEQCECWHHDDGDAPVMRLERIVTKAALERCLWHVELYVMLYSGLAILVCCLRDLAAYPRLPGLSWPMVWAAVAVGAVLALRVRQAYILLAIVLFASGGLLFLERLGQ